jgi:hypothetical protein
MVTVKLIDSTADLISGFAEIRDKIPLAESRPELSELYRRAGYLISIAYASSHNILLGIDRLNIRQLGDEEFNRIADSINARAREIGTTPDYDDRWGDTV